MAGHSSGQSCSGSAQESVYYGWSERGRGQDLCTFPVVQIVLGDHYYAVSKGTSGGRLLGREVFLGRSGQDLLLGENSSVSTEMAHEVGGDSAEVKGQDVPVIVGVGSSMGKAIIPGRARRVAAT
jgi:hypothetical protein